MLLRLKGKVWLRALLGGVTEGEGKVDMAEGEGHWCGCLGVRKKVRGSASGC